MYDEHRAILSPVLDSAASKCARPAGQRSAVRSSGDGTATVSNQLPGKRTIGYLRLTRKWHHILTTEEAQQMAPLILRLMLLLLAIGVTTRTLLAR